MGLRKNRRIGLIFSSLCLPLIVAGVLIQRMNLLNKQRPLKVFYPLGVLRSDISLLDPYNTETVWEYYLLENISCGLIKDSVSSVTGYTGGIAERYFQPTPNSWAFQIRKLNWSDGTELTATQILNWINDLKSSSRRHIKYLKDATTINYDPKTRLLQISFSYPIGKILLHELSLADAAILPEDTMNNGWKKTIGPYKVEKWDKAGRHLELKANPFSPLYSEDMPQEVDYFSTSDQARRNGLFTSEAVDIIPVNSICSKTVCAKNVAAAPATFYSYPMNISFLAFNKKNADANNFEVRSAFASVVSKVKLIISAMNHSPADILLESQMIPESYHGRLNQNTSFAYNPEKLRGKHFRLAFPSPYSEYPAIAQAFRDEFASVNATIEFVYSDNSDFTEKTEFARIYSFLGNQLDASGSWSFLLSPPGPLSDFLSEVKQEFDAVYDSTQGSNREFNLLELHKQVLGRAIAIPLFIGRQRYLLSNRVDASRWDKFDARMRLFELRWQ